MPWCSSHELTSSRVSGCGATSSATCSLDRYAPYLKRRSGTRECRREWRNGEHVLWVSGIADFVERIDQGVLAVGLKRKVEVDRGAGGRVTQSLPVGRGGIPRVFHTYVIPKSCKGRCEAPEGSSDKYGENRELMVSHNQGGHQLSKGLEVWRVSTETLRAQRSSRVFMVQLSVRIEVEQNRGTLYSINRMRTAALG